MTSSSNPLPIPTLLILLHLFIATAIKPTQPPTKALVIPLIRDDITLQRIIKLNIRTPPIFTPLTIDLQGQLLWLDCDTIPKSSTNRRIHCNSARCTIANSQCQTPYKNTPCNILLTNPVQKTTSSGELHADIVRINATDGTNPIGVVSVPRFSYGCGHTSSLKTLARGVKGIAGLGQNKLSIPSQFSSYFRFSNVFALCASSSSFTDGFVIFGDKPYNLFGELDASTLLSYTPLLTNKISPDYYVGVTAIKINSNEVKFDKSLLAIAPKGTGGTKISSTTPYTIMHRSIHQAVTTDFVSQVERPGNFAKRVKPIPPFTVCYAIGSLPVTKIGVVVPDINLVMQNANVVWTISGTNSMVQVNSINAYCLGVLNGGVNATVAVVIGSYQLENNLVQFDLVKRRVGFSSSLLFSRTRCDNFNFTSA